MNLIEFYKEVLISTGCRIDENGIVFDEKNHPIKITVPVGDTKKDKILILPTKEVLKDPNWDDYVAFHPTCESRLLGSSQVLNTLAKLINLRIYHAFVNLIGFTCNLAVNKSEHQNLTLAQSEFLVGLENISKANVEYITKTIGNLNKWDFVRIKITRNEKIGDTTYFSVAKLNYHIAKSENEKDSQKSVMMFNKIMEKIIPNEIQVTSTSDVAPKLITLLSVYKLVAEKINSIINMLGKFAKFDNSLYSYPINLDWCNEIKEIPSMFKRDLNLVLNYNEGIATKESSHNSHNHNLPPIHKGNNPNNTVQQPVLPPINRPLGNTQVQPTISDSKRDLISGGNTMIPNQGYPPMNRPQSLPPFDMYPQNQYGYQQPVYHPQQQYANQGYDPYGNQQYGNRQPTIWEQNNSGMNSNPGNFYQTSSAIRNC